MTYNSALVPRFIYNSDTVSNLDTYVVVCLRMAISIRSYRVHYKTKTLHCKTPFFVLNIFLDKKNHFQTFNRYISGLQY